jgi:hypothetical protein
MNWWVVEVTLPSPGYSAYEKATVLQTAAENTTPAIPVKV